MVYVFLANGFEELEALTVVDLLRRAEIQVKTVSIMEDRLVYGSKGVGVEADILFKAGNYETCQMLILPGGMPGTTNLCNHRDLNEELREFYGKGKPIAAICAAPMVLGRAGLLAGHKATIYQGMEEELAGAQPVDDDVVVSENIITSKGPGTAMDFALTIIEYIKGTQKAEEIAAELLYHRVQGAVSNL
ncbi:Chaperone protein YajL [uncultured Eubacterium sp.]|nr:Chaperone protein YajL [uncultured Eubacterium sp.]